MKYYGTKNNNDYGFYEQKFNGAIEITDEYWKQLISEQNRGKIIIPVDNSVIAVNETDYEYRDNKWTKLLPEEKSSRQLSIQNAIRAEEIKQELENLDKKRIRALSEPSLKDDNTTWLEYYNAQIAELRSELMKIM